MIFFVVDPSTGDLTHLQAPTRLPRHEDLLPKQLLGAQLVDAHVGSFVGESGPEQTGCGVIEHALCVLDGWTWSARAGSESAVQGHHSVAQVRDEPVGVDARALDAAVGQ